MNLGYPYFKIDSLNSFLIPAIGLFFVLTFIYSLKFMRGKKNLLQYYAYIIFTAIAAIGVVLANNLAVLLIFWGFLGFTLYLLINFGTDDTGETARKALIIVGGTDALMLLGIGILFYITGSFQMDNIRLRLSSSYYLPALAYFCIALACFAKAGAMPLHSWIPPCAKDAPIPVVAYLPASLDKLLGIYLLARISLNIFEMNAAMNVFLMCIGAFTVLAAVMMALVQHDMKKLLGYHAVSQVGYMVLGIATGNPIGIAGGIFHMINHAVYKSCLFFTAGNVEYRTKTTELDELGGLSRLMPITYISCLVASLSISGVPPFNGFVSKWMIYQGLIQRLGSGGPERFLVALCLVVALFGSGLTLASFMKLIHSVFLGQRINQEGKPKIGEVSPAMWIPCLTLAVICVVFGVFANQLPLKYFIFPAVPGVEFTGIWYAGVSTALIIIALVAGLFIFNFNFFRPRMRQDKVFVGGEPIDFTPHAVTGTEFYNTIREYGILKGIYRLAEKGAFDIYEQGKKLAVLSSPLRYLHNGILPTYLVWMLLGMLGLLIWSCI